MECVTCTRRGVERRGTVTPHNEAVSLTGTAQNSKYDGSPPDAEGDLNVLRLDGWYTDSGYTTCK